MRSNHGVIRQRGLRLRDPAAAMCVVDDICGPSTTHATKRRMMIDKGERMPKKPKPVRISAASPSPTAPASMIDKDPDIGNLGRAIRSVYKPKLIAAFRMSNQKARVQVKSISAWYPMDRSPRIGTARRKPISPIAIPSQMIRSRNGDINDAKCACMGRDCIAAG